MPDAPNPDDLRAPGWDAISAAFERLYPGQEPRHWGTLLSYRIGGPDPLDGISVCAHDATGVPHWHYVSYGMSELYGKDSEDKQTSGWGFEFTFRLKRDTAELEPPQWPLGLLQNLARYVFKTGNTFAPGHYLPLNGPIALETDTAIHAAMFVQDPELKQIDTPHGSLEFLQLVGVTLDELAAARAWNTERFLDLLRQSNPLLVTDLSRKTVLTDPAVARAVAEGTARDGSSSGWVAVRELRVAEGTDGGERSLTITLGASGVGDFQALLRGRTAFGRPFKLIGPQSAIQFSPGATFFWDANPAGGMSELRLPAALALQLAEVLRPQRGDYAVAAAPGLTIRVVPSQILDDTGSKVVETIG